MNAIQYIVAGGSSGIGLEIANLAVFTLTEAHWMTGQILGINGGLRTLIK